MQGNLCSRILLLFWQVWNLNAGPCTFFPLFFLWWVGYIVAFVKIVTMHQKYHTWFTSSTILVYLPLPIPGIVSTGLIFPFTYVCTQYLHCIHPTMPFPHPFPPPTGATAHLHHSTCLPVLFSDFVKKKKKKWHFCLFKIAIWGVSLWHFHVYVYFITRIGLSLLFFSFYLSPLLTVILTGLKVLYSFLYREYINHIHLLNLLLLPFPLLYVTSP
jgi:hypothetical protein